MAENSDLPIVKISWVVHNRQYEVGIIPFLKKLGVNVTQQDVLVATKKILSEQ